MNPNEIYESFTSDYSTPVHHAVTVDGQWFERMRVKDIRYGYKNTAWRAIPYTPSGNLRATGRAARLPKAQP